jgi:hypothetical protein
MGTYFTAESAEALVKVVGEIAPGVGRMPAKHAMQLVSAAVRETTMTAKAIEDRIREAGCLPADISGVLLHYGALAALIEDLPATDDRRQLVAAGRKIGEAVAASFGQKIREELDQEKKKEEN